MDDEEIVRLADNNKALISACSDPAAGMESVVKDHEVVYVRISQKRDSGFANMRTSVSLNRGQLGGDGFRLPG